MRNESEILIGVPLLFLCYFYARLCDQGECCRYLLRLFYLPSDIEQQTFNCCGNYWLKFGSVFKAW
mgnify:CR=1 FL=1